MLNVHHETIYHNTHIVASKGHNYQSAFSCVSSIESAMVFNSNGISVPRLFLIVRVLDPLVMMNKGGGIRIVNRWRSSAK